MDNDTSTKVQINLKDGTINLEGSEAFVSNQIEWLKDLILKTPVQPVVQNIERVENEKFVKLIDVPTKPQEDEKSQTDRFKTVFGVEKEIVNTVIHTEDGGNFSIITKKIKGGNADKQVSYTLLYLITKEFYGGQDATFEELRELCRYNACLDSGNFAANYNNHKDMFIVAGKPGSKSKNVKLTAPGRNKAKELIVQLAQ